MIKNLSIHLSFIVLFLTACQQQKPVKQTDHPPVSIQTTTVGRMDVSDSVQIFGIVKLRQEAWLASQFGGRLSGFSLLNGDQVTSGQKIGVIIPPMREALNQAANDMSEEQRKLVSDEINEIPLYSPIEGVVLDVMQHNGDVLQKGESILHIANLNVLDIYGELPVAYLPRVRQLKSLRVEFIDYPHRPLSLKVKSFSGSVNPKTQTINIRLALKNPNHKFRPGMMVQISFPDKVHKNSMVIPNEALLEDEGIYSVYVLNGDRVEKRNIAVGVRQDEFVEVVSGLEEGEKVATQKVYSLTDGMEVQLK